MHGTLAGYALLDVLGEGAMGTVYGAVRESDGMAVALKVLRSELSSESESRHRFTHEARALVELRHPNLVESIELGEVEGTLYLALRHVEGRPVSALLTAGRRIELADAVKIACGVGNGLAAMHRAGLVHRDVKPANVILAADGSPTLVDLGLARAAHWTQLTMTGLVVGTMDYLAPELVLGEEASPASDVYSLGCTLYEMLCGQPPFRHPTIGETMKAQVDEQPPDPRALRPEVAEPLAFTLLRLLEKDPAERPTATGAVRLLRATTVRA